MLLVLQQEHHVTEKKEEKPTPMNAFDLISMSKGLNLGNLFNVEQVSVPKALCLSLPSNILPTIFTYVPKEIYKKIVMDHLCYLFKSRVKTNTNDNPYRSNRLFT